jgi:uncharacterized DUF497 family protein
MAFVSTNAYTSEGEVGMEFSGFDWDRGNIEKCQKHGISAKLIESVFERPVAILPDKEHSRTEQRLRAIGKTAEGRAIFVGGFYPAPPGRRHSHTSDQRALCA